ncbi:histidine kinase [Streptomyces sp. NPDC005438]|uniref:sensor histidine kinase n=1 Tax=Streptomyces sp. NPDC005438 TaxID=3156880 RepID=UPI0033BF8FB9
MPYFLLVSVPVQAVWRQAQPLQHLGWQLVTFAVALPVVAVTGLFPLARSLEVQAVRALCGVPGEELSGEAAGGAARRRTAAWYTLHLGLGGVVSGVTLAVPPLGVVLVLTPFSATLRDSRWGQALDGSWLVLAPVLGLGLLALVVVLVWACGALLARSAVALLGPTPAERLAAAERRAAVLASRNRLARELHDSVGHALSAVALQASAARRVLEADPEFVREALEAIEETSRRSVGELDAVLGVLREEGTGTPDAGRPLGPTLAEELPGLLSRVEAAGLRVETEFSGDLGALPGRLSAEVYRMVQEGLTNVLRHAASPSVRLRLTVEQRELGLSLRNPMAAAPPPHGTSGGRGVRGVLERAAALGGTAEAGPDGGDWWLRVRLPWDGASGGVDR